MFIWKLSHIKTENQKVMGLTLDYGQNEVFFLPETSQSNSGVLNYKEDFQEDNQLSADSDYSPVASDMIVGH